MPDGTVALLKTTIDAASASDLYPLYEALAEVFGEQAPQARAAMRAPLQCATACLDCGGEVAVWVYDPHALDR